MSTYKEIPPLRNPDLFWSRHKVDSKGCWVWTGTMNGDGYGRIVQHGSTYQAHRVAYTLSVGPIPTGLTLDHLCRNRACINPEHLEPVTLRGNLDRRDCSWSDGFCINGHEIAVVGVHICGGRRQCGQCGRDRVARYKAKKSPSGSTEAAGGAS